MGNFAYIVQYASKASFWECSYALSSSRAFPAVPQSIAWSCNLSTTFCRGDISVHLLSSVSTQTKVSFALWYPRICVNVIRLRQKIDSLDPRYNHRQVKNDSYVKSVEKSDTGYHISGRIDASSYSLAWPIQFSQRICFYHGESAIRKTFVGYLEFVHCYPILIMIREITSRHCG